MSKENTITLPALIKMEEMKANGEFSFRAWIDMMERAYEIRKACETASKEASEKALKEGLDEGRELAKIEVAKKLRALSVPIEKIAEATGLSIDEIEKL